MSDEHPSGPVHLTIDLDARVTDPRRLGASSQADLGEAIAGLIRRYAREGGLELTDPSSVEVRVTPAS
jgi:hypothetical protein